MANTRDIIGDQATLDGLVSGTLTGEFEEDGIVSMKTYAFYGSKFTSIKLPSLKTVNGYSFYRCNNIQHVTSDDLPLLSSTELDLFGYCDNLTDVVLSSANGLGASCFQQCPKLETIDLAAVDNVAGVIRSQFDGTNKLTHLIIRNTKIPALYGNLRNTEIGQGGGAIYVPIDLVDEYKANSTWNKYYITSIENYPLTDFSTISDSWSDIIANNNYATDYKIGDTKIIDLGSLGKYYMELVAFDTDNKADNSGKARMTWVSKKVIIEQEMNNTTKTVDGITSWIAGGWEQSDLRAYLKNTVKPLIPSEVRNAIVPVTKVSSTYENNAIVPNGQTTTDDVWIPSAQEIMCTSSYETDGVMYTTFKDGGANKKTKFLLNNKKAWWLRTCNSSGTFRIINSSGTVSFSTSSNMEGAVLGFCI